MTKSELQEIIRAARNLAPNQEINPDEEWDSLDHLSIIASLSMIENGIPAGVDVSSLNSFNRLFAALSE
jgi:hypothetical protein